MRTLIAIVLLTSSAVAQEPTADQWRGAGLRQAAQAREWYDQNIESIEQELAVIRNKTEFREDAEPHIASSGKERWFICENKMARQVYSDMLKRRLVDLKNRRHRLKRWIAPELSDFRTGAFGYVLTTSTDATPSLLLKEPEKLGRAEKFYSRYLENELLQRERSPAVAEVFQVIDADSFLAKYRGDVVKVEGMSTLGMTDGAYVAFIEPMFVPGTTTYAAAIGTNTVFVLRPIPKETQEQLDAAVVDEDQDSFEPRTWSDISGKFSIDAELADFDGKMVYLTKEDGSEVKVPFAKLSKDDKEYVNEQLGAP